MSKSPPNDNSHDIKDIQMTKSHKNTNSHNINDIQMSKSHQTTFITIKMSAKCPNLLKPTFFISNCSANVQIRPKRTFVLAEMFCKCPKSHINNICDTRNLLKWIRGSPPPQVAHNYSRKLFLERRQQGRSRRLQLNGCTAVTHLARRVFLHKFHLISLTA